MLQNVFPCFRIYQPNRLKVRCKVCLYIQYRVVKVPFGRFQRPVHSLFLFLQILQEVRKHHNGEAGQHQADFCEACNIREEPANFCVRSQSDYDKQKPELYCCIKMLPDMNYNRVLSWKKHLGLHYRHKVLPMNADVLHILHRIFCMPVQYYSVSNEIYLAFSVKSTASPYNPVANTSVKIRYAYIDQTIN